MAKNTGLPYELFVQQLQQYIINNENSLGIKQVLVEHNKTINDMHGNARQFDLYWEFEFAGNIYKTVIECKDYASPITIDKIDAFLGKTHDIPGLKLIYATKTGYQSGAKNKAQAHNIELLIIKEGEDQDWIDENGNHLIKKVQLDIEIIYPPVISRIIPTLDSQYIHDNNINIEILKNYLSHYQNVDIFIKYSLTNKSISFFNLAIDLPNRINNMQYGQGTYQEEADGLYLEIPKENFSLKMKKYKVHYELHKPQTSNLIWDFSKELLGVVQNITKKQKSMVFRDKILKRPL